MKKKQGISLIVLIVTIIVIIILAAAVILTITKNNPVESAKEATFKEDVRTFQDDLALKISKEYTNSQGNRDEKINATGESVKNHIPSFTNKYVGKFAIVDDKLVYTGDNEKEKMWVEELNISTSANSGFDAEAWDAEASDDNCFIWSEDKTIITGYNEEALSSVTTTLRIPSKCTAIKSDYATAWNGYRNFVGGITNVEIPETVTEIGDYAFLGFKDVETIIIPDSVTTIGDGAFKACTKLTNITLSKNLKSIGAQAFGAGVSSEPRCESLKSIVIPDSVTSIGDSAFGYCENLESVTLPKELKIIEDNTFAYCYKLSNVVIPDSVESIGLGAFRWCYALGKIIIPVRVTSMGANIFERAGVSIYCRTSSQPSGWNYDWNFSTEVNDKDKYHDVIWGYTGN